jgi:Phage integrase, N-terminal SAM-like domain
LSPSQRTVSIEPAKTTVVEFLDRWERDWAIANVSPKTAERYSELIRKHIVPHIGRARLQKLRAIDLSELYAKPCARAGREGDHVHRMLHRASAMPRSGTWFNKMSRA